MIRDWRGQNKMKNTKIILSLILCWFIFIPSLVRAELNLNIFSPPQGQKISEQKIMINSQPAKVIHYESQLSSRDILDFYYNYLTNLGWQVFSDNRQNGAVAFTKDKDKVIITALNMPEVNKTSILINYYAASFEECPDCEAGREIKEDTPGEDLASVPRYPKTQRILSMKTQLPLGRTAIYKSASGIEEILDFYTREMSDSGWYLKNEISFSDLKNEEEFTKFFKDINLEGQGFVYTNKNKDMLQLNVIKDPQQEGSLIMVKIYEKYYRK